MNGPPQKPTTACSGASSRRTIADRLEDRRDASPPGRARAAARPRRASAPARRSTGPTPSTSSTSRPIAATGVMMSANITAASTSWRRTGCSVTSAVSSADRLTSKKACRSRIARYSGSERPACRMNHTGVRSTASRRAARTSNGSTRPRLAADGERAACRPLGRLDARRPARGGGRARARRARERRHRRPGATGSGSPTTGSTTATIPIVWDGERTPLPRARAGRARDGGRARARADPARPLPLRARPRRRAPRLVLRARQRDGRADGRRAAADRRAARRAARVGRAGAGRGTSASRPRTPRATPSSPARSTGSAASASGARGRSRRTSRAPGGSRTSRTRCSARRCWTGVELERLRGRRRACRPSRRPADEPWLYDGRIVLARRPEAAVSRCPRSEPPVRRRAHEALTNSKGCSSRGLWEESRG